MKALVVGAGGQLGRALVGTAPEGWRVSGLGSTDLDVTDAPAVSRAIRQFHPDVVVNASAYTKVDEAESHREAAFAVNAEAPGRLAEAARTAGARLVHVSTDYVFDGHHCRPYTPEDTPRPVNVYGESKLAGEQRIREAADDWLVLRTAWLYSGHGHNFVRTMLRLMGERDALTVVADQVGSPTWVGSTAAAVWQAAASEVCGVHHWVDAGVASWYDLAQAVYEEAGALGLIRREVDIRPVGTEDYPTPAPRPAYGVLDTRATAQALDLAPVHWRVNLRRMLRELAHG